MKVYAKVKCDACDGLGKIVPRDELDYFHANDDGTERCWVCQGQGEVKGWVDLNEIVNSQLGIMNEETTIVENLKLMIEN